MRIPLNSVSYIKKRTMADLKPFTNFSLLERGLQEKEFFGRFNELKCNIPKTMTNYTSFVFFEK